MLVPNNYKNILVVGSKKGLLKYIDLTKNKMVSVVTDHQDFIGDMVCLEKLKVTEADFEYFHKNLNFILIGSRSLGLYNGYGNAL